MSLEVTNTNVMLFDESAWIQEHLVTAKLCFQYIAQEIICALPEGHLLEEITWGELIQFEQFAFDSTLAGTHSVYYLREYGALAPRILNFIERERYALRLLEDDFFETCYEEAAYFLEKLTEFSHKVKRLDFDFDHQYLYLNN